MGTYEQGDLIWQPSEQVIEQSQLWKFQKWLKDHHQLEFSNYQDMWKWSVTELEQFWGAVWEFTGVVSTSPYEKVLVEEKMPGAEWFKGAKLNFAENIFAQSRGEETAIYFKSEFVKTTAISWNALEQQVASVAASLQKLGVQKGDRVGAYLPNVPEAIVAFLATASIGAIWSICAPDFGSSSVIDRFKQIEPVVLFAVDGYSYNGKLFDKRQEVEKIRQALPSVKETIFLPYIQEELLEDTISWASLLQEEATTETVSLPFDHPLWIVYSSGTTGLPKPIVHSHGGIIVEYKKILTLQHNQTADDTVYWFTSTGWMMWNLLMGSLITSSTIVLYDGSPSYPTMYSLWELAEETGVTSFGTSAPFILNSAKMGISPKERCDLSKIKAVMSTGAPLTTDGYGWVYEHVKEDVWLVSISGGTDICSGFVGGIPTEPVYVGEIQGAALGVAAYAFNEEGEVLTNEVGELVITKPMPSMPIYFWNDEANERYQDSYFDEFPNVWTHGDWIQFDEKGSCIIYGRSDSTINRSGVRMGTSDLYRIIGSVEEVVDSLVIDLEQMGKSSALLLFVVLKDGLTLDETIAQKIKQSIREELSPRFAPDEIYAVADIPKTLNGKKMEVPIRKLLLGFDFNKVINIDSMSNPEVLPFYQELASELNKESIS